jgi:hypothetical protein
MTTKPPILTEDEYLNLIAAVPELLEALREADKVMDLAKLYFPKSIHNTDRFTLLNVQANSVRAAIAKAEGRTTNQSKGDSKWTSMT